MKYRMPSRRAVSRLSFSHGRRRANVRLSKHPRHPVLKENVFDLAPDCQCDCIGNCEARNPTIEVCSAFSTLGILFIRDSRDIPLDKEQGSIVLSSPEKSSRKPS